jgi:hypothetical protein
VLREGDGEPLSPTVVKFVRSVPPVLGARALAELRDALVSADAVPPPPPLSCMLKCCSRTRTFNA